MTPRAEWLTTITTVAREKLPKQAISIMGPNPVLDEASAHEVPQRKGIVGRLTSAALANLLRHASAIIGQIALVPILLKCWGAQLYGEWQILAAAVTYLALLDFVLRHPAGFRRLCRNQRRRARL